ncbi:hypothetical protein GGS20DRAFT_587643 [Poronia punctata]|nr:hypothetical protein GGS20DRAFT_587643 [Poronia punctata]
MSGFPSSVQESFPGSPSNTARNGDSKEEVAEFKTEIAARLISPKKLVEFLRDEFPGSYECFMMHNTYRIKAPRKLTLVFHI